MGELSHTVRVRVNDKSFEYLEKQARKNLCTVSDYVRKLVDESADPLPVEHAEEFTPDNEGDYYTFHIDRLIDKLRYKKYTDRAIQSMIENMILQVEEMPPYNNRRSSEWDC